MKTHRNTMERYNQLSNNLATCSTSMLTEVGVCCASALCAYYTGQQYGAYTYSTMHPYTTYASLAGLAGISAA